jgi:uncharacterized membrane protein
MKTYSDRDRQIWIAALAGFLTAIAGVVLVMFKVSFGILVVLVGVAVGLFAAIGQIAQRRRRPDDQGNT